MSLMLVTFNSKKASLHILKKQQDIETFRNNSTGWLCHLQISRYYSFQTYWHSRLCIKMQENTGAGWYYDQIQKSEGSLSLSEFYGLIIISLLSKLNCLLRIVLHYWFWLVLNVLNFLIYIWRQNSSLYMWGNYRQWNIYSRVKYSFKRALGSMEYNASLV